MSEKSLADRLRNLKLKEASEVDDEALQRAADAKKAALGIQEGPDEIEALVVDLDGPAVATAQSDSVLDEPDLEYDAAPQSLVDDSDIEPEVVAEEEPDIEFEDAPERDEPGRLPPLEEPEEEPEEDAPSLADSLLAQEPAKTTLVAPKQPRLSMVDNLIEKTAIKKKVNQDRSLVSWLLGNEERDEGDGVVTEIPEYDARRWKEQDFYPVQPPYTFARVLKDRITGELMYETIEPALTKRDQEVLDFVEDALIRGLNVDPGSLELDQREKYLADAVARILEDYKIRIDRVTEERINYYVRRNFLGFDRINVVMNDTNIEDISCDGAAQSLFIFHRVYESIPTNLKFPSEANLDGFVIRMAQRSGKSISISEPILDAALEDGSRLQATLGREVTQNGSTFTIRRFRPEPFTPLDLVEFGTMDVPMLAWFWMIVEFGSSMIMAGGTASGKTTSLNAFGQFIPPQSKVVTIEDTREVNLPHKNWIKAVTRSGSMSEGSGEIGMFELLKAALRQRPEYILVGEVRGVEATVAFQGMATGHTVYSTMHADSARSVVYRLENDPINIPRLVLQALDVIAIQGQARVGGKRVRRINEVVELVGMDPSTKELLTNTVYRWDPHTDTFRYNGRSFMIERIATERNMSPEQMKEELDRRIKIIEWMIREQIPSVQGLTDIVKAYYLNPDAVLSRLEAEA